eukprot:gb/GEZN01002919.1/.p1 GENE.gb/GEZN01002919.1/~~gb/GEZN01002919.1/.p1  ORF type:complete len:570 (+),score=64.68 gb/GEZN01002919.1/:62-1771(+)
MAQHNKQEASILEHPEKVGLSTTPGVSPGAPSRKLEQARSESLIESSKAIGRTSSSERTLHSKLADGMANGELDLSHSEGTKLTFDGHSISSSEQKRSLSVKYTSFGLESEEDKSPGQHTRVGSDPAGGSRRSSKIKPHRRSLLKKVRTSDTSLVEGSLSELATLAEIAIADIAKAEMYAGKQVSTVREEDGDSDSELEALTPRGSSRRQEQEEETTQAYKNEFVHDSPVEGVPGALIRNLAEASGRRMVLDIELEREEAKATTDTDEKKTTQPTEQIGDGDNSGNAGLTEKTERQSQSGEAKKVRFSPEVHFILEGESEAHTTSHKSILTTKLRQETYEELLQRIVVQKNSELEYVPIMQRGAMLTKCHRKGQTGKRFVVVSEDGSEILWGKKNFSANPGAIGKSSWFPSLNKIRGRGLLDIIGVHYGPYASEAFSRHLSGQRGGASWLCFSLEYVDRTLDFICKDTTEVSTWFLGLQAVAPLSVHYLSRGAMLWQRLIMLLNFHGFGRLLDPIVPWTGKTPRETRRERMLEVYNAWEAANGGNQDHDSNGEQESARGDSRQTTSPDS